MTDVKSALVVRGGWFGHQPVEATDLFIPHLEEHGFQVRVEESPAVYADADVPGRGGPDRAVHDHVHHREDEFEGLRAAVEAGTGLAGWHGGIADSYRNTSDYLHLIGGQFACHPGKHPAERIGEQSDNYVPYTVNMLPAAAEHPITAGIDDFDLVTEQYWVLTDDYIDVLATTTQAVREWDPWHRPVTSPAIWTRQWGRGRSSWPPPGITSTSSSSRASTRSSSGDCCGPAVDVGSIGRLTLARAVFSLRVVGQNGHHGSGMRNGAGCGPPSSGVTARRSSGS